MNHRLCLYDLLVFLLMIVSLGCQDSNQTVSADREMDPISVNPDSVCLEANPDSPTFSSVLVNRSALLTMSMSSCGANNVTISDVYIAEDGSAVFSLEPTPE